MERSQVTARGRLSGSAKAVIIAAGLIAVVAGTGCDGLAFTGLVGDYGLFDPSWMIGSTLDYRNDVMDWSAQAWSDVILYDDYIPYDTWDAYDLTYPNY